VSAYVRSLKNLKDLNSLDFAGVLRRIDVWASVPRRGVENQILVAQVPPLGVLECGHAGPVINKLSFHRFITPTGPIGAIGA